MAPPNDSESPLAKYGEKSMAAAEALATGKPKEAIATMVDVAGAAIGAPGLGAVVRMLGWEPTNANLEKETDEHRQRQRLVGDLQPVLERLHAADAARLKAAVEDVFADAVLQLERTQRRIPAETIEGIQAALGQSIAGLPAELAAVVRELKSLIAGAAPSISAAAATQVPAKFDVFVSYAHADEIRVRPIVEAFRARGLRVWFDDAEIGNFESITQSVVEGLAHAKALLAFYSATYPTRRACQWELTAAFIAGQHEGDPRRRIFVINPESGAAHIDPIELRDALFCSALGDRDEAALVALAEAVAGSVSAVSGPFGAVRAMTAPPWYGGKGLSSPRFVGRVSALWQVHSALSAGDLPVVTARPAPGVAQIRGMGGIGKSLLAEEYALRFAAAYPGGVFVLKGITEREDQLVDFAARKGVVTDGLDAATVEGLLEARLREAQRAYLWIVDDLPGGLGEEERRRWLAPNAFGKTLFTTRSRDYGSEGDPGVIDLGVLSAEEAYELLTARRKPEGADEEQAAKDLVEELGRHALAVDVAGGALAQLKKRGETYADFLADLRDIDRGDVLEDVAKELRVQVPNGHEASIARTLLRSIDLLDDAGRDFLRLASEAAADVLPFDFVDATFSQLGHKSRWGAADVARAVVNQGLAEESGRPRGHDVKVRGGYVVHVLVARTMRTYDRANDRRPVVKASAVQALLGVLPRVADIRNHAVLAAHVTHARHLARTCASVPEAALLSWVAHHDFERGTYLAAREHMAVVLAASRRLLGDEHPDTLTARLDLAETLFAQGDLDAAREHQEAVLAARRRLLGDEHPDTLIARLNLAGALKAQGNLVGAREHQEAVLSAMRRVLEEDHPNTLIARLNLATTLFAQGDLVAAREHEEAVLAARLKMLGEEHPDTLIARNNLAGTLLARGDLVGAREHQNAVLTARRRMVGEEHPATLTARSNLAATLKMQGDLAGAREHQEAVLAAMGRLLGEDHPSTLTVRNNLAETLFAQGDLVGARERGEEVLAARLTLLGKEHPDTLIARLNLAGTLFAQGDLVGARDHQETVLVAMRKVLGEDHPATLTARNNLAQTLFAEGDLIRAEEHQEAVLAAMRRLLGEEHPTTLTALNNLATTLFAQGDLVAAREHQEDVLATRRMVLGEEHPDTLIARLNLAQMLKKQGDFGAARAHEDSGLAGMRKLLGQDHPATLGARLNVAETLFAQGDLLGAREHQEEVLAARRMLLGEDHPDTLSARSYLAATIFAQGDLATAREHQEGVLAARRMVLGEDHPDTVSARLNLAAILETQGKE